MSVARTATGLLHLFLNPPSEIPAIILQQDLLSKCELCPGLASYKVVVDERRCVYVCADCASTLENRLRSVQKITKNPRWALRLFIRREILISDCKLATLQSELCVECWWCRFHCSSLRFFGVWSRWAYLLCQNCVDIPNQILAATRNRVGLEMARHAILLMCLGLPRDIIGIVMTIYWSLVDIKQIAAESIED